MGYIAPIPHHQYKQYQERDIRVDKYPFRFIPIQPVKALKNKSKQTGREKMSAHPNTGQKENVFHKSPPFKHIIHPDLIAKVTGKGTYFNEYV